MIDIREKVICCRDLYRGSRSCQRTPAIDIKAGTPFYPYDIPFGKTHLGVSGFAGYVEHFPIEWFEQYFETPLRKKAYMAWLPNNIYIKDKESFIQGYIAATQTTVTDPERPQ